MNLIKYLFIISALFVSCEDVIELDLNESAPHLVIVGEITNQTDQQVVTLSKTVPFTSESRFEGISNAQVEVVDGHGTVFRFTERSPGVYVADHFAGIEFETYELHVSVDGKAYTASSQMPPLVGIDSVGTAVSDLFGEEQKYVALKYQDPPHEPNYYRYLISVNDGPVQFVYVASDKFNDGKYVSERLGNPDEDLVTGDAVVVYMQCVDKAMFDFWNAVQATNPGTAAPANPPSNISNGALGYFGAYSMAKITTEIK